MISYITDLAITPETPYNTFKWRNDRSVFDTCRQYTLLEHNEHIDWLNRKANDPTIKMFGITYKEKEVGVCGFTNISRQSRHAEISLYIGPEHQGLGISSKVLYTLCRHGFEDFNFNKLWGECFNHNIKAIRIFKKLGFIASTGHIQHYFRHGKYIDTTFMTLLEKDWENVDQIYRRDIREPQTGITESDGINPFS